MFARVWMQGPVTWNDHVPAGPESTSSRLQVAPDCAFRLVKDKVRHFVNSGTLDRDCALLEPPTIPLSFHSKESERFIRPRLLRMASSFL